MSLFKACKENDKERILKLQRLVMKVSTDLYSIDKSSVSFLKGLKAALYCEGLITDCLCAPLKRVSEEDMETIRKNLAALKQEIAETL